MLPAYADDTLIKVKDALNVWAAWMERDHTKARLGYPYMSTGFINGGSWGNFCEDNEYQDDKLTAETVNAILEDMPDNQQTAIFYFHVAAVIKPRRTKVEDDYADALIAIEIGLRARNRL